MHKFIFKRANGILHVLFLISICVQIKESSAPLILSGKAFEVIFLKSEHYSDIMLSLSSGFFVAYIVWFVDIRMREKSKRGMIENILTSHFLNIFRAIDSLIINLEDNHKASGSILNDAEQRRPFGDTIINLVEAETVNRKQHDVTVPSLDNSYSTDRLLIVSDGEVKVSRAIDLNFGIINDSIKGLLIYQNFLSHEETLAIRDIDIQLKRLERFIRSKITSRSMSVMFRLVLDVKVLINIDSNSSLRDSYLLKIMSNYKNSSFVPAVIYKYAYSPLRKNSPQ